MIDLIFKFKRIFLSFFVTLILLGIVSWFTMPREEDPRLKNRFSNIQVIYPGATAEEVQRLVIKPLEDKLVRVDKLKSFKGTARSEFAFISLDLKSKVSDTNDINQAWDDVEDAIEKASIDFPEGVLKAQLDRNSLDQDAIVISVTSKNDLQYLMGAIRNLETKLLSTPLVASVNRFADPDEAIRIDVDEEKLSDLGVDILQLKQKLQLANQTVPSGSIKFDSKKLTIKTNSSFKSVEDIKNYTFELSNGENKKLSEIARVERSIVLPNERLFRFNGKDGISLGIVPQRDINLEKFGESVKQTLDSFKILDPDVTIDIITFQPGNVSGRITELSESLLSGIAIIGIALFLAMGLKMSLLAVLLVPAITFSALSFFSFADGSLHQISIAAFVVSLGLLVDNVIVVLESIQDFIDSGLSQFEASKKAVASLALPLTAATGTTIASFLPMLGAAGTTADFTRTIPIVVVLSLLSSFAVAMLITPLFGMWFLKPGGNRDWSRLNRVFNLIGQFSVSSPRVIVILTTILIFGSLALFPVVKKKFFNDADRSQLVVEIVVPEGSHYSLVDSISQKVESYLLSREDVSSVAAYVGRGTPRFFYNLSLVPRSPHVAQMILTCLDPDVAKRIKDSLQVELDQKFPEAFILIRSLAQGPPTIAPIEYRISGSDPSSLSRASEKLVNIIRDTEGTTKVRSTDGVGVPILYYDINDANSSKYNLERSLVGAKIYARTRGLDVGSFRYGKDVFPILLSNAKHETHSIEELSKLQVGQTVTGPVSLSAVSGAKLRWEPSVIFSYNGEVITSVYSEIQRGYGFDSIIKDVSKKISADKSLENVTIQLGGEAAESEEANTAILKVIPLGILLLLISLLIQFNSFKKVFIILGATFPMFIGIIPGLIMLGQPFGFFSLLGLLALIGIVVNNGILIVDQIDLNIDSGLSFEDSVVSGVARRIRPIFLTTLTTVLGLLPLGFTNASLWPPFAWTMIFGLLASMVFTPLLVPAMYVLLLNGSKKKKLEATFLKSAFTSFVIVALLLPLSEMKAQEIEQVDLFDLVEHVEKHPLLKSQFSAVKERSEEAERLRAQMYLPSLGVNAQRLYFNRNREFQTPIGNFGGVGFDQTNASVRVKQSIYNPKLIHGEVESVEYEEKSSEATRERLKVLILSNAIKAYSQQLQLKFKISSLQELVKKLTKQKKEISRLLSFGRVSELDLFKIDLALNDNISRLYTLEKQYEATMMQLGAALGISSPRKATEIDLDIFKAFRFESSAASSRKDLQALDLKMKSLDSKIESISFSRLPEVSLIGSYNWESPSAFSPNDFSVVGIEVSWGIWSSNERSFQKTKINHLKNSLEYSRQDLRNSIDSEQKFYQATLLGLINEWPQKENDFKRSREIVRLENTRYYKGKSTLNELLDAEILNQKKEEDVLVHPYAYLLAWASYQESTDFPDWEKIKRKIK